MNRHSLADGLTPQAQDRPPITITVTVGQLPPALLQEDSFGLDLRGWNASEGLKDEPEGADEPVLTIRFHVDGSLEPIWRIVNDRRPDGRRISAKDREAFGLVRLGGDIDRHLSWTRGSLLTRQTDSLLEVGRVLADAHRQARELVSNANLAKLATVAERLEDRAKQLGVNAPGTFRPGLEAWRSDIIDESAIRDALGSAAKATRAFKQVDPGEQLGTLVGASLPAIPASDLSVKLSQVAAWCYGE